MLEHIDIEEAVHFLNGFFVAAFPRTFITAYAVAVQHHVVFQGYTHQ